ncbi:MAG: hypothetical protein AAF488_09905 [Planctomycetota bacterium]
MTRGLLVLTSLCLLPGCGMLRINNPVEGLSEVSLLPIAAESLERSQTWTDAFRKNLLRVNGIDRVVLTDYGMQHGQPTPASFTLDDLPIAQGSQALLEIQVLTFDPYYPPSASVEVNLYVPGGMRPADDAGLDLDRQGAMPRRGSHRAAEHRLTFQKHLRADDPATAWEVEKYALLQLDDDRGMDGVDRVLRSSKRFIDFVAYETLEEVFSRVEALHEEIERAEEEEREERGKT